MNIIQKTFIAAALVAGVGMGIHEGRRASQLQDEVAALLLKQESLATELQQERAEAASELALAHQASGQPSGDSAIVAKLRAELARLQRSARELAQLKTDVATKNSDPTELAMRSWVERVTNLREKLTQAPEQRIPEFQFLTDVDWFNAAKGLGQPPTDAEMAQAMTALRNAAKDAFAPALQSALHGYAQANNGQAPSDLSQLQPYFSSPLDESLLQRYSMTQPGTVTELATALDDQDNRYYQITANTIDSASREENMLQPAVAAYSAANSGQTPTDPSQLLPYATTPAEQAAIKKLLQGHTGP